MKSKNIPADIRSKTIKEAQSEINDIIEKLENPSAELEKSVDQYNRVIQLNQYIQDQFKKKSDEIRKSFAKKVLNVQASSRDRVCRR